MPGKEKAIFNWSGGKDSALALYYIQKSNTYDISELLTTINSDFDRVSMHGFRTALLEVQAKELGYELQKVLIPKDCSNEDYEKIMGKTVNEYKSQDVNKVIFGDIFLEDVRKYREKQFSRLDMIGIFPLWKVNTRNLADEFIKLGFKAIITCVDSTLLEGSFVGREFDVNFLEELPKSVDPCGENGEFHTFVYDGPIFKNKISVQQGDVVVKKGRFYFCDLIPI
jgi:uncharacterized protein (TIGR00290 family)